MVKLEMMVDGIPDFETDHEPTDFAAIAEAVGIRAMRVEDPREVRDTLPTPTSRRTGSSTSTAATPSGHRSPGGRRRSPVRAPASPPGSRGCRW
jgi:hypothetical protein